MDHHAVAPCGQVGATHGHDEAVGEERLGMALDPGDKLHTQLDWRADVTPSHKEREWCEAIEGVAKDSQHD